MRPLAHHAGEDSLIGALVAGASWLPVVAAVGRARIAAALARLTGKDDARRQD
jgi:hypothetical protein